MGQEVIQCVEAIATEQGQKDIATNFNYKWTPGDIISDDAEDNVLPTQNDTVEFIPAPTPVETEENPQDTDDDSDYIDSAAEDIKSDSDTNDPDTKNTDSMSSDNSYPDIDSPIKIEEDDNTSNNAVEGVDDTITNIDKGVTDNSIDNNTPPETNFSQHLQRGSRSEHINYKNNQYY